MAEQRYVYDVQETDASSNEPAAIGSVVDEYATQGWRLVETLHREGTTVGLVFERKVDD